METRRKFSREFKLEAVKMVKDRGVAARQVSRHLDINQIMLRRWIKNSAKTRMRHSQVWAT
jgi:transposase